MESSGNHQYVCSIQIFELHNNCFAYQKSRVKDVTYLFGLPDAFALSVAEMSAKMTRLLSNFPPDETIDPGGALAGMGGSFG